MRNFREIKKKKALQMCSSLHRCPVGEPGGGSFTGTSEEKENVYLGSFFLYPEDIKVKSGGHLKL